MMFPIPMTDEEAFKIGFESASISSKEGSLITKWAGYPVLPSDMVYLDMAAGNNTLGHSLSVAMSDEEPSEEEFLSAAQGLEA